MQKEWASFGAMRVKHEDWIHKALHRIAFAFLFPDKAAAAVADAPVKGPSKGTSSSSKGPGSMK